MSVATARSPVMHHEVDSISGRHGFSLMTFTNKSERRSVSGVVSRRGVDPIYSINIRAGDLTKREVEAIFRALGELPPPL
jgi:hypothetical protein